MAADLLDCLFAVRSCNEAEGAHVILRIPLDGSPNLPAALQNQFAATGNRIMQLPDILIFELGRFVYDWRTQRAEKSKVRLFFPPRLEMLPYITPDAASMPEEDRTYRLRGVVVHSGTIDSGHYRSYVQEVGATTWTQYDDSRKYPVKNLPTSVYGGGDPTAHLLFYERVSRTPGRGETFARHGLPNPGVVGHQSPYCCFANSVFQQLFAIGELRELVLTWTATGEHDWRHHFQEIFRSLASETPPDRALTVRFLDAWQSHRDAMSPGPGEPVNWRRPCDAAEFLQRLLEDISGMSHPVQSELPVPPDGMGGSAAAAPRPTLPERRPAQLRDESEAAGDTRAAQRTTGTRQVRVNRLETPPEPTRKRPRQRGPQTSAASAPKKRRLQASAYHLCLPCSPLSRVEFERGHFPFDDAFRVSLVCATKQ